MHALVLGVGDAFTRRYFGSSALIQGPGGYVLLDCPDLVHRALYEATGRAGWTVEAATIDDILLTHLHGDHCNGLESFGFRHRIARQRQESTAQRAAVAPRLHTSRPAADRVWERLAPAMDGAKAGGRPARRLEDFFDLSVLDPDLPAWVAGLRIECRFTNHPIPTIGLIISDGKSALGWSSDTSFDEAHIQWLSRADVIVHECGSGPPHTSVDTMNALPDTLRAKIRLIHIPDDFDPTTTDLRPLEQGEVLEL